MSLPCRDLRRSGVSTGIHSDPLKIDQISGGIWEAAGDARRGSRRIHRDGEWRPLGGGEKVPRADPTRAHGDGRVNVTGGAPYFCRLDRLVLVQLAAESVPRCLPHEGFGHRTSLFA